MMSDAVTVIDYRWLGDLHTDKVSQLQLHVKDERLGAEDELTWVNAKLAGTLWPEAVLEFYLDHVFIKAPHLMPAVDEDFSEDEIVDIARSLLVGKEQLILGHSIASIIGTMDLNCKEFSAVCREVAEIGYSHTHDVSEKINDSLVENNTSQISENDDKSRETTTTHSEIVNVEGSPNGCNDYEDVKLDRQIEMLLAEMNLEEESDTTSSHDHLSSRSSNNDGSVLNIHDDFAQALGSHEVGN